MLVLRRLMVSLSIIGIISFSCVRAETLYQKNECRTKVEGIDREIQYLEDLKRGLEGRAIRYENQAQRLQFEKDQLIESKRFWNMAEQNRKASAELDQKIKEKKQERQEFIEKNNCKDEFSSSNEEVKIDNSLTESTELSSSDAVTDNTDEVLSNNENTISLEQDISSVKESITNEQKEISVSDVTIAESEEVSPDAEPLDSDLKTVKTEDVISKGENVPCESDISSEKEESVSK